MAPRFRAKASEPLGHGPYRTNSVRRVSTVSLWAHAPLVALFATCAIGTFFEQSAARAALAAGLLVALTVPMGWLVARRITRADANDAEESTDD